MRVKNEQEIEEMAVIRGTHGVNCTCKGKYRNSDEIKGFKEGAKWMEQDLLSQASEGFEEWFKNEIEKLSNQRTKQGDITLDAVITITMLESNKGNLEKLWQASRLSMAKENEELKKENEKLKQELLLSKPLYSRRKLEERIKEAEEIIVSWNEYLKRENELASKIGTVADDYIAKWSLSEAPNSSKEEA